MGARRNGPAPSRRVRGCVVPLVVRARQRAPPPVKLLLVNPSRFYSDAWVYGELHHLFALFSYVRNRCPEVDVDVLDLEKELFTPADDDQVEEFLALARAALATRDFDVVGISCWSSLHYLASLEVARLCRELHPECTIVVGGYHPSALPGDFAFEG